MALVAAGLCRHCTLVSFPETRYMLFALTLTYLVPVCYPSSSSRNIAAGHSLPSPLRGVVFVGGGVERDCSQCKCTCWSITTKWLRVQTEKWMFFPDDDESTIPRLSQIFKIMAV